MAELLFELVASASLPTLLFWLGVIFCVFGIAEEVKWDAIGLDIRIKHPKIALFVGFIFLSLSFISISYTKSPRLQQWVDGYIMSPTSTTTLPPAETPVPALLTTAIISPSPSSTSVIFPNSFPSQSPSLDNTPQVNTLPETTPTTEFVFQTQVIFTSGRDGNAEIYSLDTSNGLLTNLTNNPAWDMLPSASNNGHNIAFHSNRDGQDEIYLMNRDGSNQQRLTFSGGTKTRPSLSPDGSVVVFASDYSGSWEIYGVHTKTLELTELTRGFGGNYPSWSPDGKKIAFTSYHDTAGQYAQIYIMNADGTNPFRVTYTIAQNSGATWSPDCHSLAFHTNRDGNWEVYTINLSTGDEKNISQYGEDDEFPSWSSDGYSIIYQSYRDNAYEIYEASSSGTNQIRIYRSDIGNAIAPLWITP